MSDTLKMAVTRSVLGINKMMMHVWEHHSSRVKIRGFMIRYWLTKFDDPLEKNGSPDPSEKMGPN